MKTRENLTREDSIITAAGVSEGGDDRRAPRDEKQNEEIKIPKSMIEKARNRKRGNRRPNITTGPLK